MLLLLLLLLLDHMKRADTIYGLSTPFGKSGIAIIKLSGPNSLKIIRDLKFDKVIKERCAILGRIYDRNLDVIDEIIVIYYSKNNSYTGEDVVELQTHGSPAVINSIFNELALLRYVRIAENGEFTRRSFENNKISLNKAESILELINAETEYQRKIAIRNYNGELEKSYSSWRHDIINLLSISEAYIDFPDDLLNNNEINSFNAEIKKLEAKLVLCVENFCTGSKMINGINICIAGNTNVGKSTLMNILSNSDTSIVSNIHGTTRDIIKSRIEIEGVSVLLHDIAGIRKTNNQVELIGINKGKNAIKNADILVIVIDIDSIEDTNIFNEINKIADSRCPKLIIVNKIDLHQVDGKKKKAFVERLSRLHFIYRELIYVSLIDIQYNKYILKKLTNIVSSFIPLSSSFLVTNTRHQEIIKRTIFFLQKSIKHSNLELKSEELRYASHELEFLLGKVEQEEILDKIFSNFCIGK